jgi:adenine phosphoribosyltransferase
MVQQCVSWAIDHKVGLVVIGGGQSGHCLWPNVVSIDMSAFHQIHIVQPGVEDSGPLVVVEAGCKSGDVISKTMQSGLTVPLGSRPSVGAGLWLQGGIGHLARLHGLACDAIVGAIVVSVATGQVFCVGHVPEQHRPVDVVHPENEVDLLWALKGAGTNSGIVISVTFKAFAAPTYSIQNWIFPLNDEIEAQVTLRDFDQFIASPLPRDRSVDAYLYWETGKLHLGVSISEPSTTRPTLEKLTIPSTCTPLSTILAEEGKLETVDGVGLFDTEMYMSGMHGGHAGGKTSSFKRCLFLKRIGASPTTNLLVAAIETRPSSLCYLQSDDGISKDQKITKDCKESEYRPTFIFNNDAVGDEAAKKFSKQHLLPFVHDDLQRLATMVRTVPNFPRQGIEFRDVLGICKSPGGLALCTSSMQTHLTEDWENVDMIASCETGGFLFASTLAMHVDRPLALIREAGKLPPPTISVTKSSSHVSTSLPDGPSEKRIELGERVIPIGSSVVIVDDVLATGRTLCAVLQLLVKAGFVIKDLHVMVVAEFPNHQGRELLRQHGFGGVKIQSLLVFGGV